MATQADQITADTKVEELITRYPAAAQVFIRRRMSCVGCDVARFESLVDVCRIYRQPVGQLIEEIRRVVRQERPLSARR